MTPRMTMLRSVNPATPLAIAALAIGALSLAAAAQEELPGGVSSPVEVRWNSSPVEVRWDSPPVDVRWNSFSSERADRAVDVLRRHEIAISEGRRVLQALQTESEAASTRGDLEAVNSLNNRIIGMAERLREFERQLDLAWISVRAEATVDVSSITNELERLREVLAAIESERGAASEAYHDAVSRQAALRDQAGAGEIGLDDLRADIGDRRRRALDLEIERQVATATADFLRAKIGQLLDRIERAIVEDEVVSMLRDAEAAQRALVKQDFATPVQVTAILERRLRREDALAERFGRGLVLQLESRLVDAELKLLTIEVQRRTLLDQVSVASGRVDVAMEAERVRSVEAPRLESRLADLDAASEGVQRQLRLRQVELVRALEQVERLQETLVLPAGSAAGGI